MDTAAAVFELLFTHPVWAYRAGTLGFASGWPTWLLGVAILAAAAAVCLTLQRRNFLGVGRRIALGVLQSALLAVILTMLWRPVLHVERVKDRENVLAVALDASGSMAHGEGERSRLQDAVAALNGGPLASLRSTFDVQLYSFAREPAPLPSLETVPAPGAQTRIGTALLRILQSSSSLPLAGVVLVSDGAENGGSLTELQLLDIAAYGVPIHAVGVGPETLPGDVELVSVRVARRAPPGSRVTAEISVRHDAAANTQLKVYDGDTLIAARALELPAQSQITTSSIEFPAGDAGLRNLRFVVDALTGERNVINNARRALIEVPGEPRQLLYVEGEPRWEYKFIRRAADSDRSLRMASIVKTTQVKFYRQGVQSAAELADGFPADAAALFAYDAVVIGSLPASTLSEAQHKLLAGFVDRRGGSLLMLAGPSGLAAGGWNTAPVAASFPVRLTDRQHGALVPGPVKAQLTEYGVESPVTRLDAQQTGGGENESRNSDLWASLPPLGDHQPLGRLKPGAVVLVEGTGATGRVPLLTWQRYGRGQSWLLGTASTMRWQMQLPSSDTRHDTLWRQLLHAIADPSPRPVALSSERAVYEDEPDIRLEGQVLDAGFEPLPDVAVELQVSPEQAPGWSQPMTPSPERDGSYEAALHAAAPGMYRVDMTARRGAQVVGSATVNVLREDGVAEHFDTRQNRAVLERLAALSGGRYWRLDELSGLARAIPYTRAGIVERQMLDLWKLPAVFLLLLLLKCGEWLLRLRWGRL